MAAFLLARGRAYLRYRLSRTRTSSKATCSLRWTAPWTCCARSTRKPKFSTKASTGEALREAVLNAVVHRDYSSPAPIQVRVYNDRIALWNPGALPLDWTLDKLMETHASAPHNPGIANAFFRAGMVESWGRGINDIVRACRASAMAEPRWELEQNGLRLEFMISRTSVGPRSGNAVHETTRERRGSCRKADDPANETARGERRRP